MSLDHHRAMPIERPGPTCLEPGRELDALMCEKVFGWRWVTLQLIRTPIGSVGGEIECLLPPDVPDSGPCRVAYHVERGAVHEGYFSWSVDWIAIPAIMKQIENGITSSSVTEPGHK